MQLASCCLALHPPVHTSGKFRICRLGRQHLLSGVCPGQNHARQGRSLAMLQQLRESKCWRAAMRMHVYKSMACFSEVLVTFACASCRALIALSTQQRVVLCCSSGRMCRYAVPLGAYAGGQVHDGRGCPGCGREEHAPQVSAHHAHSCPIFRIGRKNEC